MMTNVNTLFRSNKKDAEKIARRLSESYEILREMTEPNWDEYWKTMDKYTDGEITTEEFDQIADEFDKNHNNHSIYLSLECICARIYLCRRRSRKLEIEFEQALTDAKNNGLIVY